jgi:hypothetical protein
MTTDPDPAAAITEKALALRERLCADEPSASGDDPGVAKRLAEVRRRLQQPAPDTPTAEGLTEVERPLGTLLMVAGVLGGLGAITSGVLRRSFPDYTSPMIRTVGWATICVVVGILGLVLFRKVQLPDRLVTKQTFGVWLFIAIAGALTQIVGYMLYLGPYALIPVTSLLFGVGIATLAFQTRRWLLAPALACFAVSLLLAAMPQYSREILGAMLIVAMGGVGLSFRMGAPLDPAA